MLISNANVELNETLSEGVAASLDGGTLLVCIGLTRADMLGTGVDGVGICDVTLDIGVFSRDGSPSVLRGLPSGNGLKTRDESVADGPPVVGDEVGANDIGSVLGLI